MKMTKKIVGLVLALLLVMMAVCAGADTITVENQVGNNHSFAAYQIFSGTMSEKKLVDIEWGNGINSEAFVAALHEASIATDKTSAADVAEALAAISADQAKAVAKLALANKVGNGTEIPAGATSVELAPGYYLIVDTTSVTGADLAANAALLQVSNEITIQKKTSQPTVEKKVQENNKYSGTEYGEKFNDVADWNMGDTVTFRLIGTVPDMTYYDTYKYIFHDEMSAGLTRTDYIKVYLANDKTGSGMTEITGWTATEGNNFTVSFANLKDVSGATAGKFIIVEYKATLNQNAVVGLDGNPNNVKLEYSNKPDQSGSGNDHSTGETPKDYVIVFTYELDVTKVDGQNKTVTLSGAEFKLKNSAGKWATVTNNKVTGWADREEDGTTLTTNESGLIQVIGLDDGTYSLKETKAPAGYNKLTSEITVVVTATTSNGQSWTEPTASTALTKLEVTTGGETTEGTVSDGKVAINVENNQGATLPETGGMGTTIFYVAGSILLMGAVVLLITKRRVREE